MKAKQWIQVPLISLNQWNLSGFICLRTQTLNLRLFVMTIWWQFTFVGFLISYLINFGEIDVKTGVWWNTCILYMTNNLDYDLGLCNSFCTLSFMILKVLITKVFFYSASKSTFVPYRSGICSRFYCWLSHCHWECFILYVYCMVVT